jgi:hypothetical protein
MVLADHYERLQAVTQPAQVTVLLAGQFDNFVA